MTIGNSENGQHKKLVREVFVSLLLLCSFLTNPLLAFRKVRILDLPRDVERAHLEIAARAQNYFYQSYFHVGNDFVGLTNLVALRQAARRKLDTRLIVDAITKLANDVDVTFPDEAMLAYLQSEGVQIRIFHDLELKRFWEMLLRPERLRDRMHEKITLIDDLVYIVGGRNRANPYLAMGQKLDFIDLDVIVEDPISAAQARKKYLRLWASTRLSKPRAVSKHEMKRAQARLDAVERVLYAQAELIGRSVLPKYDYRHPYIGVDDIELIYDEPTKDLHGSGQAMLELIRSTQRSVVIQTPYFVLSHRMLPTIRELLRANREVIVYTNSPKSTDTGGLIGTLRRAEVAPLIDQDLTYLEMLGTRTMHRKIVIVDERISYVGSANLNNRSEHHDLEIGVKVQGEAFAKALLKTAHELKDSSLLITPENIVDTMGPSESLGARCIHALRFVLAKAVRSEL